MFFTLILENENGNRVDMTANVKKDNISIAFICNYNNDKSRTVNQMNNSPKSLSRLEIYRQTRNA